MRFMLNKDIPFIDLNFQYKSLKSEIHGRINKVLEHGQYILGPEVKELEEKLQLITGSDNCISVSSGTDALLISLMALGVGPGDEIITTPFTFVSTAEVIVLLGAKPVFVDVELDTCNLNSSLLKDAITSNTKAIIPVSLYGQPSDMDEINTIASQFGNIPVIEDAAQSFGAKYKGKKSCNLSTIGCTSFFPSKPLGCYGDGGAIFTNNKHIANSAKEIRIHGQSKRYHHTRIGIGGRMDTLQCAVLLAKLEKFDWEIKERKKIGERYNNLIDKIGIKRVQQKELRSSVFAQYTIIVENRQEVRNALKEKGIPSAVHYPIPLNEQPAYKNYSNSGFTPNAKILSEKVLSLPMSPYLSSEDQSKVIKVLKSLYS